MNTCKGALFGGALFAAGIAAASSGAAFDVSETGPGGLISQVGLFGYDFAGGQIEVLADNDSGPGRATASVTGVEGLFVSAYYNPLAMGARFIQPPAGDAYTSQSVLAYFQVPSHLDAQVSWDILELADFSSALVEIVQIDPVDGSVLNTVLDSGTTGGMQTGMVEVPLEPGLQYRAALFFDVVITSGEAEGFVRMVVPSPAGAAMLGPGLLLMSARRRTRDRSLNRRGR